MKTETKIDLPMLKRAAIISPATANDDDRTIDVVWSSGSRVKRQTFCDTYDEELSLEPDHVNLDRLNAGAPFLNCHGRWQVNDVIGSIVPNSAKVESGQGVATIRFSQREEVTPIWEDVKAGHIRQVSVGYRVDAYEVSKSDNEREVWRAIDWTPVEISAVPVGADPQAVFRSQPETHQCAIRREGEGLDTMSEALKPDGGNDVAETEIRAQSDEATVDETVVKTAKAESDEKRNDDDLVAQTRETERERVATIFNLADKLDLKREFASDLVKRGVALNEARKIILDKVAEKSDEGATFSSVSIPLGGRDEQVTRRDAAANALLHRYSPTEFPLEDAAREYRGMTLMEMARESLGHSGVNTRGLSRDDVATRALQTSSDFPLILSAVTNKTLRQAYEAAPRTFTPFCRQVLATDFKAMHRVQIGEAPRLLKVNEGGEFKRGTLGESKESYRIETYGRVVSITRQVLINDDLDAFTRIPAMYGNSIAQLESDVVWGVVTGNPAMADGKGLFHADHGNLGDKPAKLTVSGVGNARAMMAMQTGLDRKTVLNIRPAFLIIPAALELQAEQLLAQNLAPAASANVVPKSIRTLAPIAEPRLDADSSKDWYLAASPNQIDTIEYAYLEGQQGAYIESRNGFDVDGVEIKCRLDFGAKAIDWRGLFKTPGA